MIESFYANLALKKAHKDGLPNCLEIILQDPKPHFQFGLVYLNSVEANFDPTMTLLSKAYNLQHLDFFIPDQGKNDLTMSVILQFPSPKEYGNLTEYDIYGLFTHEVRELPLLREFYTISDAESGLIKLRFNENYKNIFTKLDCFGIQLPRKSDPIHRHRWLTSDPRHFFDTFLDFKKEILTS